MIKALKRIAGLIYMPVSILSWALMACAWMLVAIAAFGIAIGHWLWYDNWPIEFSYNREE